MATIYDDDQYSNGLKNYPEMRSTMGFAINGTNIPDPSVFSGAVSDLDTMGKRDATGLLHRNRVATKHPLKLEYHNIPWEQVEWICNLLRGDRFTFVYRDPVDGLIQITAYVGDRNWEAVWCPEDGIWLANLKFSVIEY